MARSKHPHAHSDELHVFLIPAHPDERMELVVIENNHRALSRRLSALVGVTVFHEDLSLPELDCGCPLSMAVNAEGLGNNDHSLQFNARASLFMVKDAAIFGDVVMVGQGVVKYADGSTDVDFISLTPQFHDWRGPGHPVPSPSLPWNR